MAAPRPWEMGTTQACEMGTRTTIEVRRCTWVLKIVASLSGHPTIAGGGADYACARTQGRASRRSTHTRSFPGPVRCPTALSRSSCRARAARCGLEGYALAVALLQESATRADSNSAISGEKDAQWERISRVCCSFDEINKILICAWLIPYYYVNHRCM